MVDAEPLRAPDPTVDLAAGEADVEGLPPREHAVLALRDVAEHHESVPGRHVALEPSSART